MTRFGIAIHMELWWERKLEDRLEFLSHALTAGYEAVCAVQVL